MEKENQTNIFQQGPYPNLDKTKLAAWLRAHSLLHEVENIRSPACTPSKTPCPERPSQELRGVRFVWLAVLVQHLISECANPTGSFIWIQTPAASLAHSGPWQMTSPR